MLNDKADGVWGRRDAETPPLKCSNIDKPLRSWTAIAFKYHVKSPGQFCPCMPIASWALPWRSFSPQPWGGISAPTAPCPWGSSTLPSAMRAWKAWLHKIIHYACKFRHLTMSLSSQHTHRCVPGILVPAPGANVAIFFGLHFPLSSSFAQRRDHWPAPCLPFAEGAGFGLPGLPPSDMPDIPAAAGCEAAGSEWGDSWFSLHSLCGPWGLEGWVLWG